MDAKNLAIVFNSVIFGEDELPKPENLLTFNENKDTVMEDLITHAPLLFDDKPQAAQVEPPLPPTPEPKPKVDYGSSYTRTHTIPPRTPEGHDFTPTLPLRPEQSIHPSRRNNLPPSQSSDPVDIAPSPAVSSTSTLQRETPTPVLPPPKSETMEDLLEDLSHDFEVVEQPDAQDNNAHMVDPPKSPDSFATAASSPSSSPYPDRTSRESSRPSLGRSVSPHPQQPST
ncbi:hypothetical protein M422DRAFT_251017 [Sphaerobolus stellatus SS14]|uniref:Rho-GAP domain-containing protein n=1 Tax=Sphaerobolus stellatus (strain SS14) TaxID=990650 RepID=A0A0C9VFC5_SPHS4|nr:hypothetical protein M422DRAFT_251017 [Sphaerobolus stellatus SS14]